MTKSLNEHTLGQIQYLCAQGDALVEQSEFERAFRFYSQALQLVPEPVEEWEATTWILVAIGDLYFLAGNKVKSLTAFEDAVRCPGGLGNPFIHLRLGQCYFELGQLDRAGNELTRAYMGGGRDILENEDPKYLEFLETLLVPPIGQGRL